MKKILFVAVFIAAFTALPSWSQVVVRVGPPPRAIVERPPVSPGPRYVWVGGYYRWNGTKYLWMPGHYVIPPRAGVIWVAPRWNSQGGTWVFVKGYWR